MDENTHDSVDGRGKIDLSICIVAMNHRQVLEECLRSIYSNPPKKYSFETIVLDNCSTDGTFAWLASEQKECQNLIVIRGDRIRNFSKNNNICIRRSKGHILLILNPDTIIFDGTCDGMTEYMLQNPEVGACTCRLLYPDGTFQESARKFIKLKYMLSSRLQAWGIPLFHAIYDDYIMSKPQDSVPKLVDSILGACMFVRRTALDRVGLFDEKFLLYAEDTDLCFRLKQAGWKITYVPYYIVVHIYARAGTRLGKAAFLQLYTATLFYAKHYWKIIK